MFEELKSLIAEELSIDESRVTEDASFKEDLGADSLDLFELVMSLEDKFGIEIPSEDLEKLVTVSDVVNYIEEHK
ncbi:MAG: acyl carrier protein [Lachnospiraceae bacterium]